MSLMKSLHTPARAHTQTHTHLVEQSCSVLSVEDVMKIECKRSLTQAHSRNVTV